MEVTDCSPMHNDKADLTKKKKKAHDITLANVQHIFHKKKNRF